MAPSGRHFPAPWPVQPIRAASREPDLEASQMSGIDEGRGRISAAPDRRGTILKYKADRGPVAYVVAVFVLRLVIWALASPLELSEAQSTVRELESAGRLEAFFGQHDQARRTTGQVTFLAACRGRAPRRDRTRPRS